MNKFERLQRARDLRLTKLQRGIYSVVKVNDDGRELVVERNLSQLAADKIAGARRDAMSDSDVGNGWTYLTRRQIAVRSDVVHSLPICKRGTNEYA